jgi:hypothetical protein
LRHKLAARRGGGAVHARDHGLRQHWNGLHHPAALPEERFDLGQLLEAADFLEVVPGAEPFAGTGQNDDPGALIVLQRIEGVLEGGKHLPRQQV